MTDDQKARADELHQLLSDLGRSVQEAVTSSAEVAAALERIREKGYEPSFVVETSVSSPGASGEGSVEMSVGVQRNADAIDTAMTALDKKFLRSLKIAVD